MNKHVYIFGEIGHDKNLLGGKGAALAEMTELGLPVPPGFTITTKTCVEFLANSEKYPKGLWEEVTKKLVEIEKNLDRKFGDPSNPLLVSVRSGAAISMPGMMDTVLNVGLNDKVVESLGKKIKNMRFVKDSYRRLIYMFANVVCNINTEGFEKALNEMKERQGVDFDYLLSEESLDKIISQYKTIFKESFGSEFPQDVNVQLDLAVKAVFKSWNNKRAIAYREYEGIPHDIGTAVTVQSMVFGNYDDNSGTGVLFTRNPSTGVNELFGEFLENAQGEDVVAGIRTPHPISVLKEKKKDVYDQLYESAKRIEKERKEMQDIEFTIQEGKLYILQTRNGKRTGVAAARIAIEFVNEGVITKEESVMRLQPRDVESSLFPSVLWKNSRKYEYFIIDNLEKELHKKTIQQVIKNRKSAHAHVVGEGLPAGPGAACGHVIFDSDLAEKIVAGDVDPNFEVTKFRDLGDRKVPSLILVKKETSPEDFHGMVASLGIVTMTGGLTSHAALVGRQIGKRVIVGAANSKMDLRGDNLLTADGTIIKQGDVISIEIFEKGLIFKDELPIVTPDKLSNELETILDWADDIAKIKVRTNADKENDTQIAINFKTTGTGLARTEHQFFDALDTMQQMILSETKEERLEALSSMKKLQKDDFTKLFRLEDGRPITIRLLDPPLHEFLPKEIEIRDRILRQILNPEETMQNSRILRKVLYYQEANPMLGLRGCRLGLLFPEITEMQVSAIIEAALDVKAEGKAVHPEIMVPLIGTWKEFRDMRKIIDTTAKAIIEERGEQLDYHVGTMIEIPRAALTADEITEGEEGADFFSFGTNDLHQMTLGYSRDDVGKFLPFYLEQGILEADPFQTIDETGTGKLMEMAVIKGREGAAKSGKYLKVGICGEQGGDPKSIDFCYRIGLDYVSCSPWRVPVARLAAAHATLNNKEIDPKYQKQL